MFQPIRLFFASPITYTMLHIYIYIFSVLEHFIQCSCRLHDVCATSLCHVYDPPHSSSFVFLHFEAQVYMCVYIYMYMWVLGCVLECFCLGNWWKNRRVWVNIITETWIPCGRIWWKQLQLAAASKAELIMLIFVTPGWQDCEEEEEDNADGHLFQAAEIQ